MKHAHVVRGLLEAWYSKPFYAEVGTAWRGAGLLYLLGLTALLLLPSIVVSAVGFHRFVTHDAPTFVNQLPPIRLRAGHASTTAPTPAYVRDPATGKVVFVVDPAGHLSELPDAAPSALLTDSQLIVRRSALETRVFALASFPDFTLDAAGVMRVLHGLEWLVPAFLYVFLVPFKWVWNVCFALLLAAGALWLVRRMPVKPAFITLLRLAVVALTPLLVVDTLLDLAHVRVPFALLVHLGVGWAYMWLAVGAFAGASSGAEPGVGLPG